MTETKTDRMAWRLRVYPIVMLLTIAAAMVLAAVVYEPADPDSRLGGDYPAFYGAGSIVLDGDWDELYSAERQQSEQRGLINDDGGFLYFAYPPFVGGVYGALAAMPYQLSFLFHTTLMAACLVGAIWLLWPWLERTGLPKPAVVAVAVAVYPLLRGITGGQNTTLSLLIIAAAVRLEHEGRPVIAGAVAAFLLFKPQFGLVVFPLLLVARHWRAVVGWVSSALLLFAVSSYLTGGAWMANWWEQAAQFRDLNAEANGAHFTSIPGFLENLFGSQAATTVGYGLAALVGAGVAVVWWRSATSDPLGRWALAAAAIAVAAPQTLYYDTGLLLIVLVAMLSWLGSRAPFVVIGVVALSWTHVAAPRLGWSPLAPMVIAAVVLLVVWRIRNSAEPLVV